MPIWGRAQQEMLVFAASLALVGRTQLEWLVCFVDQTSPRVSLLSLGGDILVV